MATRKRLKKNKQRGMHKRVVIRGKKPMTQIEKDARKKLADTQRAEAKAKNTKSE